MDCLFYSFCPANNSGNSRERNEEVADKVYNDLCDILCDSPSKREKKVKSPRGLKTCKSILDIDL